MRDRETVADTEAEQQEPSAAENQPTSRSGSRCGSCCRGTACPAPLQGRAGELLPYVESSGDRDQAESGRGDIALPRRSLHRAQDPIVRPATAEMSIERVADLGIGRIGVLRQQRRRRDDHPARAIAALERLLGDEGGLHRVRLRWGAETGDGGDRSAVGEARHPPHAGADRLAVDQHGAGAALPEPAPELRTERRGVVAQAEQEWRRRIGLDRDRPAVDSELVSHASTISPGARERTR